MTVKNGMSPVSSLFDSYKEISTKHNFRQKVKPLSEKTCDEIGNILEGEDLKELRDFLILFTKYGGIDLSKNITNQFEQEKEIKILDVDVNDIEEKLKSLGAEKIFDGTIDDIYLDLPDRILENKPYKVSFRIRYKISKTGKFSLYYTIKRKRNKDKSLKVPTRDCFEKEFEIFAPGFVIGGLDLVKLQPYRRKIKQRIAYILNDIKFDIDLYENIPPLLEIEADDSQWIPGLMKMLSLEGNTTSASGSRGVHEKVYGIPRESHLIKDPKSGILLPENVLKEHKKRLKKKKK